MILEGKSRENMEEIVKVGILEKTTIDILREIGISNWMEREDYFHDGNFNSTIKDAASI